MGRGLQDRLEPLLSGAESPLVELSLWPDTFVDFDHGLHAVIGRLRAALNDSADKPHGIEPLVDPLHGDPRFQSLLKQIGVRELNKPAN
jgi:hypothetical protein